MKLACPCGGTVRITVETAAETIACPSCDEWGTVDWWRERVAADSWRPMLLKDVTTWLILTQRGLSQVWRSTPVGQQLNRIAQLTGTTSEEYRSLAAALEKPPGTGLVY